jgi:phosphosulfolactate synthase
MKKAWEKVMDVPLKGRTKKIRDSGITMVIDKGLGMNRLHDLIQSAREYIDIIKLTFGTSAFLDENFLKEKIELLSSSGIEVMPGGTFLEVAAWQRRIDQYLKKAKELGFSTIEISDGTIEMDLSVRKETIKKAIHLGFKVITEVGKKDPKEALPIHIIHNIVKEDKEAGAFKVIVEAREAGKGVGIFDKEGKVKEKEIDKIMGGVKDVNDLIWEAPIKSQQQNLILRWGLNVNLGNIPPDDILALEALRQGFRGDTLKNAYLANKEWK